MIITFQNLGNKIGITRDMLHVYLGHFTLTKYVTRNPYERKHALSVKFTSEFVTDFINYLTLLKRRKYTTERILFIKNQLEELICQQNHQTTA